MSDIWRETESSGASGGRRRPLGSRPIVRDTVVTTATSTVGRAIGFLIPILVGFWFGVSTQTDAFFFAYGLVLLLAGVFAPVIESVLVPFIAEIGPDRPNEVRRLVGNTLVASTLALTVVGLLFFTVSKPVFATLTNFTPDSLGLISRLLLESLPLFVFLIASSILSGALNARRLFAFPAISPAFRAVIAIAIIFAFRPQMGVHSIALGYVIGELARFIALYIYACRSGIAPSFTSLLLDSRLGRFLRTASYQIAGTAVLALTPVVDKTMASWLEPGSVSILEYANRLYEIPATFVTGGLFVVLLSHWSGHYYAGSDWPFRKNVVRTAKIVGGASLGMSLILIILRNPLGSIVYGHGEFPPDRLYAVYTVWSIYLIGLAPMLVGNVFGRGHLVLKNTRLLMAVGIANFCMKVALNLVFIRPLGLYGLALSAAVVNVALALVLMLTFEKSMAATAQRLEEGPRTVRSSSSERTGQSQ